ncbi:hypothetical protein CHS0354_019324 [Potamilus streckersoni]|nr:hypothetical protein CHS0354_019324 [Potamilus streckersoni]
MSKRKASLDTSTAGPSSKRQQISYDSEGESDNSSLNLIQGAEDFRTLPKEAEVGVIEKISLKNFMCHNRLDITLGPHVNFVIGRNGSGKSAVVTALVVGLGGKASVTSRGNTIKSFIKYGKQTADVEIKLRNRGSDAYKPEEYGDSVIIHRKFTTDGSSQYRLKSSTGRIVSQRRDELARILDQFNIQVDNPVAVLNQDTSRNFLNTKSPNDKYKFFLKATQLEQIHQDYSQASEQKELTKVIIEGKIQTLPKLEKEVLQWEQKFKALNAIDNLREKTKRLKDEMAWAFVIEKEKGLSPIQKEYNHEQARLPRFVAKVEEAKTKSEQCQYHYNEFAVKLRASAEEVKQLQPQLVQAKTALQEQKKITRSAQMEVRRLEGSLKNMKKERGQILQRIQELQSSAQHDYDAERKEREGKIKELEETLAGLIAQEKTTEHQTNQFREAINKYKNDEYKLGQNGQALRIRMDKIQKNLHNLKNSRGDRLKRFGSFMPQLIQHIQEYHRLGKFHKKPIGPIGACFKLVDQRWGLAIECCLKSLLNAFVCHDHDDEKMLELIMSTVCPQQYKPVIIVTKFKDQVYDYSRNCVQSGKYQSIIDVIEPENPMVANILIDQRTVENILLIPEGREARHVMDPSTSPGPPVNCREAFTLRGDQVFCHPTLRYYSNMMDKPKFLTSNVEEDIKTLEAELHEVQTELQAVHQQKGELGADIRRNQLEERKSETQLMRIREKSRKIKLELSELKSIEDPAPVDVTTLEEEVTTLDEQIHTQEEQMAARSEHYKEVEKLQAESEVKYKDIEQQVRAKVEAGETLKDDFGNALNEMEKAKEAKRHYEQKLKEQEKRIAELKSHLEKYQEDIKIDVEKATKICPERVNTRRTPANLESEINQTQKQIKNEEKSRGDPEEITRKFKEKKEAYMKIKKEVSQLKKFCVKLDEVVTHRLHHYSEFRKMIAMRARYHFIVLLSNQHYTGKMKFNHEEKTLEMTVQPTKTNGEGAKDMRSLSGGERSFSTVCFILALWEAMESPFRCLDEFDVFMDMVNRRISMDMMMHTAKSQTDRQFIFLTPQDMSQLCITSMTLRIFEMPAPDRDQSVLPFRATNKEVDEEEN